jgi:hypothetical protein
MRTAPGGKRPQRVAYDPSSLIAGRGAVSSYVYGVGLGLVACIIPALIIDLESRAPREEGSIQMDNPSPGLRSTNLNEVVLTNAATEYTSAESDRSSVQETKTDRATAPVSHTPEEAPRLSPRKLEKVLTTAELEAGLKRARELIRIGDIAGARLVLERGTASNHAGTLFALAQTYDPLELERWRVVGPKADSNRAKHLYERANLGGRNPVFPRIAAVP